MKRNVLSWICGEVPRATSAIVLTHNIDFLFVQSVLVPRLRAAGWPRLTIFADAGCAAAAYAEQHALLDGLGVRWRVVPVDLGPYRRFHPKALFLADGDKAALAIGSGNLGHGGLSANREIWATGSTDEPESAAVISAFRNYLDQVMAWVPLGDGVREAIKAAFNPDFAWVEGLPPPAGLATAPAERPLLDQIADWIGAELQRVSVLAPYFDVDGEALATVAARFGVPVDAYLQPGRAGLSRRAADLLPPSVSLKSVVSEDPDDTRFLHAKIFAFHGPETTVMAVGSANCSRAALLAGPTWGNAEAMVLREVANANATELFAGLVLSDTRPDLPETPPNDEWETSTDTFRVLAARREGGELAVAFKAETPLASLQLETPEAVFEADRLDGANGRAVFPASRRPAWIRLHGTTSDGRTVVSAQAWVDDEHALSVAASVNRFLGGVGAAEADGADAARSYAAILELFDEYLRDPSAVRRRVANASGRGGRQPYDPREVFSEEFGRPPPATKLGRSDDLNETSENFLAFIASIFGIAPERRQTPPPGAGEGGEGGEGGEEAGFNGVQPPPVERPEERARVAAQLRRALRAVESRLLDPKFIQTRKADQLGDDIGVAAVLLVKGLCDEHLPQADYRAITKRLWQALFFGGGGESGLIPKRADDSKEQTGFVDAFATPTLSAALSLWCLLELQADDVDGHWFRFTAAELQARYEWLFAGGTKEAVRSEIARVARLLLPSNEQHVVFGAWAELIRAGHAMRDLRAALSARRAPELLAGLGSPVVAEGALLWQAEAFATFVAAVPQRSVARADVRFLGTGEVKRFLASHLLPIGALADSGVLGLSDDVTAQVRAILSSFRAAHAHGS